MPAGTIRKLATMRRWVKLLMLIVLLGTVTLGVHRVYQVNSRVYKTPQSLDRSQPVQPQDQSQPVQPQDEVKPRDQSQPVQLQGQSQPQVHRQPVQPQDRSQQPVKPQDQRQPVNQHQGVITSGIPSKATQTRQTPYAPHSGAASRSTGTHTLLLQNSRAPNGKN